MSKLNLFAFAACLAFVAAPVSVASADDAAPKVNYAKKKAGGVPFTNEEDTASAEEIDPSDIEPSAGGYEEEASTNEHSLADDMKLPRK